MATVTIQVPDSVVKRRLRARAQQKALTRLVDVHKDQYRVLYKEELRKVFERGEEREEA